MFARGESSKEMSLKVVGSSMFGRYPKISIEKTYNMFITDGWLANYGGYISVIRDLGINGRALFTSTILNDMIAVIGSNVYLLNVEYNPDNTLPYTFNPTVIGRLDTYTTDVYIAENNAHQIAIVDGSNVYIYDSSPDATVTFQKITTSFIPGYITFHDTYFICAASQDTFYDPPANNTWRLSAQNDGTTWPNDAASIGLLETKPDNVVAVTRFPSRGNMIFVFGRTVTEPWVDVGYQLFPYQRNSTYNIDYGCVSAKTIAASGEFIVWLGQNEKSGIVILISDGGIAEKISTDGIDFLLASLSAPQDSEAFMVRLDGHLFYHINFYTDNLSLFYDFNTKQFFHASDENMNYFIAKDVAFFNNQYYFVSKNNGNLYAFNTLYTAYDGAEIPRIRTCNNIRLPTQDYFVVNDVGFTIEQGVTKTQTNNLPARVDFSFSIDGGESFSSYIPYDLNPIGKRINKLLWWQCGLANDFVAQFRFVGFGRFIATDGIVNIRV